MKRIEISNMETVELVGAVKELAKDMLESKIVRIVESAKRENLSLVQLKNAIKKEAAKEIEEKTQIEVSEMIIEINWKKSSVWGMNPNASAKIIYKDGTIVNTRSYTCSGCGYDKESTVVAEMLNEHLTYMLWNVRKDSKHINAPYGIRFNDEYNHSFSRGVGMSCYYNIAEFLGGKLETVINGKNTTVYKLTF